MIPKVLIATTWWPTKSSCFEGYSQSTSRLLRSERIETELFLTTTFACSKFKSILGSLEQATEWALRGGFTHVLNLDADMVVHGENSLSHLVNLDKDVVLPGRGSGKGLAPFTSSSGDRGTGWGCCLVKTEVLQKIPFSAGQSNDFLWPDVMWFKKLRLAGITVYKCYDIVAIPLERSASTPAEAFQPE